MLFSIKAEFDTTMDSALTPHARPESQVRQQINGALLKHTRANRCFDLSSTATFEHDRMDALLREQMRQE